MCDIHLLAMSNTTIYFVYQKVQDLFFLFSPIQQYSETTQDWKGSFHWTFFCSKTAWPIKLVTLLLGRDIGDVLRYYSKIESSTKWWLCPNKSLNYKQQIFFKSIWKKIQNFNKPIISTLPLLKYGSTCGKVTVGGNKQKSHIRKYWCILSAQLQIITLIVEATELN